MRKMKYLIMESADEQAKCLKNKSFKHVLTKR